MSINQTAALPRGPSSNPDLTTISTSRLQIGVRLNFPICDAGNVLLLATGATITSSLIERLGQRGITTIKVHRSELSRICQSATSPPGGARMALGDRGGVNCPLETSYSRSLDADIDRGAVPDVLPGGRPFATEIAPHRSEAYDAGLAREMIANREQSLLQMDQLFKSLEASERIELDAAASVSSNSLLQMATDLDLFVSLGISPAVNQYPVRHALQVSMLAMAIGTNLGLEKQSLMEMGIGCLVHDAGMLHIDRRVFQSESALDAVAFVEITKHPIRTFDLMRDVDRLSGCSRLVAYQIHERCDGSGYPRCRKMIQIHQLARIAAVADVFVALVSPRPHRAGLMPYYAMEHLIRGAQKGLFDSRVVRALVQTVSLFPIGSFVQLNDGRLGRVLRSGGELFTKPVIEVWERSCLNVQPSVVDLAAEPEIAIHRPLAALNREAGLPLDDCD